MTVNAMAEIRLQGVTKRYDQATAVDKLDLAVADSSFVVLLGPTGAGKTTTLRLVAGLENADEGSIWIDNTDVTRWSPSDRDVAMVFSAILALSAPFGQGQSRVSAALASQGVARAGDRGKSGANCRDAPHFKQAGQSGDRTLWR